MFGRKNTCQSKKCCTYGDGYVTWWDRLWCKPYKAEQTEPSNSEKPNNSTISKMEQVEDEFKQFDREDLILLIECQKERIAELLAKDEPQTEEWYTYQDEQEYNDRWQTDAETKWLENEGEF